MGVGGRRRACRPGCRAGPAANAMITLINNACYMPETDRIFNDKPGETAFFCNKNGTIPARRRSLSPVCAQRIPGMVICRDSRGDSWLE
ncbi:hypothetical protein AXX16_2715 [Serratia rubidaea]|nr:hypothetical protein AXX16_2715 [Serratia rubidaea]